MDVEFAAIRRFLIKATMAIRIISREYNLILVVFATLPLPP